MRRIGLCVLVVVIVGAVSGNAQEHAYSLSAGGSFTTSSKLFHHATDPDEFIRSQFQPLDDIFGATIDVRRTIEAIGIQIGLSIEYLSKTETFNAPITTARPVSSVDGFTALPIELSGYFDIPVGDETIRLYMGGGGGIYLGNRRYAIANVDAPTVGRNVQLGIHVLSGAEYTLSPGFALRSELKFRNVQFETTNKFQQATAQYQGRFISLPQEPIVSRINIDGMMLTLGLAYRF